MQVPVAMLLSDWPWCSMRALGEPWPSRLQLLVWQRLSPAQRDASRGSIMVQALQG